MSNQDILNMIKELENNGHTPTFILCVVEKVLKDNVSSEEDYNANITNLINDNY